MDYTLIISTPDAGRTNIACATFTDVQNQIAHFIRYTTEKSFVIEVKLNV